MTQQNEPPRKRTRGPNRSSSRSGGSERPLPGVCWGHAQWLVEERLQDSTIGHSKPVDPCRLVRPGFISEYDNSCSIFAAMILLHFRDEHPFYKDDVYGTLFNVFSEDMRGKQAYGYGYPFTSFVYGVPVRDPTLSSISMCSENNIYMSGKDFVFEDIANNGLPRTLVGLLPSDITSSTLSIFHLFSNIGVYDRYLRKGVQSFLPSDSSPYLHNLAKCADEIVAEVFYSAQLQTRIPEKYQQSNTLDKLKSLLSSTFS